MTTPQTGDPPSAPVRPLTLTVELHPHPPNDLLAGRLIAPVLHQLWAHDTQAHIELSHRPPPHQRSCHNHHAIWATTSDQAIIGLEMGEVIELVEIFQDLATWLDNAPKEVDAHWQRRTGGAYPLTRLCSDLDHWIQLLATRTPLP